MIKKRSRTLVVPQPQTVSKVVPNLADVDPVLGEANPNFVHTEPSLESCRKRPTIGRIRPTSCCMVFLSESAPQLAVSGQIGSSPAEAAPMLAMPGPSLAEVDSNCAGAGPTSTTRRLWPLRYQPTPWPRTGQPFACSAPNSAQLRSESAHVSPGPGQVWSSLVGSSDKLCRMAQLV